MIPFSVKDNMLSWHGSLAYDIKRVERERERELGFRGRNKGFFLTLVQGLPLLHC